jgi:hypothetical protein
MFIQSFLLDFLAVLSTVDIFTVPGCTIFCFSLEQFIFHKYVGESNKNRKTDKNSKYCAIVL